jgi:photosystem II stability/assembly factor-like uncharacterized protein
MRMGPAHRNSGVNSPTRMNASADCLSKGSMASHHINPPAFHLVPLVNLCGLAAGISLAGIANGAETMFNLYKSTDQGVSWFSAGHGLPSEARINALSMAGKAAVAGTDRGIFVSHDAGAKWQPTLEGIGTESRVLCFATDGRVIFAGTQKHGVLVSGDEGWTWKGSNTGLTDLYVRSLLVVGSRLYAGLDSEGVFVSENAGASWRKQRSGLPDSSQVFDLAALGGTVFAGLYSKGLYRWETERALWIKAGEVRPLELVTAGESLVVGHNPGGVFVSDDEGKTWRDGNAGLPANAPTWTLAASEDRVFFGTSGKIGLGTKEIGLFASRDRGRSWIRSDAGLPPSSAAISFVVTQHFILAGISSQRVKSDPPPR